MERRLLWLLLTFSGLLVAQLEALNFKDYRKRLFAFNPATLTPQCRIVFQKCAPKLLSMVHVLDNVSKRWKEYESIPCMKNVFDRGFPDYKQDCSKSGLYGDAVRCQLTDEVMDVYVERSKLAPALVIFTCSHPMQ
ncbi:uncharacterized protein LOC119462029 isoform X1 [Dermacentor silvarum]|uniref:uncharacterized protein LOC119462029 isoform X1 n=1 Tax=Dermacentor silvarum TaxID=543639 RepID=UPI0021011BF9|nr:uncharacterized protein LOC119462029 isoform X1 [Dermacentor silvarum]